jgi:drug/metabolite transporter (DMT)-like permease
MSWFSLAALCAFLTATTATLSKLLLRKNDIFFVGWARFLFAMPAFLALVYFYRPGFSFSPGFWKTVAVLMPLELFAFLVFLKALQLSPLSLTFPFLGFTPVFAIFFSYVLLGERPGLTGAAGIILVSVGAYLLNANAIRKGVLEPIRNIYRERGSALMLLVALIYGITSVLGKKGTLLSPGPLSFLITYYTIFFAALTPLTFLRAGRPKIKFDRKDLIMFLLLGTVFTAAMLTHFSAIVLARVPYVISVKRLSLILSVLYGAVVFKEKNIRYRMLGSLVMLVGAATLLLER